VFSEFGAGASPEVDGLRTYSVGLPARDFTEDYQEELYRVHFEQVLARDYVTGTMPWIFADFRDDKRSGNPVKDFNLKGVVTYDRQKKKAFHFLAETYADIEAGEKEE